jgi:polysaccharide chain length determinant protein (PEP-CTERM system associated)
MEGTAETTEVSNRAAMARKFIFSQKSMKRIVESEVWQNSFSKPLNAQEFERVAEGIRSGTEIRNLSANLIEISYKDTDPMRAFKTVDLMTKIFIEESLSAKQNESQAAFNFIDEQVRNYQKKLAESEQAIKEFKSKNVDASESAKANASQRLIELRRELEALDLELLSEQSALQTYKKQLTGESRYQDTASIERENQLNSRIQGLQERLAELRLQYHETYPDIVQLKGQIEELQKQLFEELEKRKEDKSQNINQVPTGQTAQIIQSQILTTESNIAAINAKKTQIQKLMDAERTTLEKINEVEAEIAELTRDYQVNQTMYQNLLSQRETARISMNIDLQNQGLTLRVQEPASIPLTPKGIHFSHIIFAGFVLSILIPVGIVFALALLDKKIRDEISIQRAIDVPLLASLYTAQSPSDKTEFIKKLAFISSSVVVIWSFYGLAVYFKMKGA